MARFQLDLSDTMDELLSDLVQRCDLKTKKDVVENSVMLLAWAVRETQEGRTIAAVDEARQIYRQIETPALAGARQVAERARRAKEEEEAEEQAAERARRAKEEEEEAEEMVAAAHR